MDMLMPGKKLSRKLDEEVADLMIRGLEVIIIRLTTEQSDYMGISKKDSFKPQDYNN